MNSSFENYVDKYLESLRPCVLSDAIAYALKGGKRVRANLIFSLLKGMNLEEEIGYDAALALEMIHAYSLIHDDLPAMDNDDMRRGKPSLHKAYREDIAILAGDQLLTDSFRVIASSDKYDDDTKVNIINCLSDYAGMNGMIYGQLLDVTSSSADINEDKLFEIQDNKTGGLFKIACLMAMYINHENNPEYYLKLGSMIGQIFQNQDDLFDQIKSEQETGKCATDIRNDKGSALVLYRIDELKKIIDDEFTQLDKHLIEASFDTKYLKELLERIRNR